MISRIIVNKTRNILLKEERRFVKDKINTIISLYKTTFTALKSFDKRFSSRKTTLKCIKCEKFYKDEHC